MKKSVILFGRQTYQNEADNKKRLYYLSDSLGRLAGQAKSIRYQFIGFRNTTGCELKVYLYETPWEGQRAHEVKPGGTPFYSQAAAVTTLRSDPLTINGPFSEFVSLVFEVKHVSDSAQVEWEGLVAGTLIMEE